MIMNSYKEIGGYLELETYGESLYHKDPVLLNSGRNAFRYIIRAFDIKTLFVPYYTCPAIWEAAKAEHCNMVFYDIDINFLPAREFPEDAFILANNYFGACRDNIKRLSEKYKNLIVDNAQSFYSVPYGIASFYSPRKFFGLPDGGMLYCEKLINEPLIEDVSFERMSHLLKRYDLNARAGYDDFRDNDALLSSQPIRQMSKLTKSLMGNINYERSREKRNGNFAFLHEKLYKKNELVLPNSMDAPMVYPLLIKSEGLRKKLIDQKIYTAQYWGGIEDVAPHCSFSTYLAEYLLPLPIDQRYGSAEMEIVLEVLDASI